MVMSSFSKSHSRRASIGLPSMPQARSNSCSRLYVRACSRQSRLSLLYFIGFQITPAKIRFFFETAKSFLQKNAMTNKQTEQTAVFGGGGVSLILYISKYNDCLFI